MADPLWVTYAWVDNEEGDFSYLVQELRAVGVEAIYDRVSLVPGQRLWDQIGDKITKSPLSGWAYLLTPNSVHNERCREELAYALYRALTDKGAEFPLIGLLKDVQIADVPPALQVRLCVNLADPKWQQQAKAGVEARIPKLPWAEASRFIWNVQSGYRGNPNHIAVEVRPRFSSVMYWRFVIPASATVIGWGHGPASGGAISGVKMSVVEGQLELSDGTPCAFFGSGDALSASVSAYAVFENQLPAFVAFGTAREAFGPPVPPLEVLQTGT